MISRVCLILIFTVTVNAVSRGSSTGAQLGPSPGLLSDRWPAQWIMQPNAPRNEYGVYLFRKQFELTTRPGRFVVHVSADARYRLFVNGRSVSFGPQRSDMSHWRYDSLDLTPFLV